MNRTRPVRMSKVRQRHAAEPIRKPGKPYNGPNFIAQRESSAKKSARKTTRARKAA